MERLAVQDIVLLAGLSSFILSPLADDHVRAVHLSQLCHLYLYHLGRLCRTFHLCRIFHRDRVPNFVALIV